MGTGRSIASGKLAGSDIDFRLFLHPTMFLLPRFNGDHALCHLVLVEFYGRASCILFPKAIAHLQKIWIFLELRRDFPKPDKRRLNSVGSGTSGLLPAPWQCPRGIVGFKGSYHHLHAHHFTSPSQPGSPAPGMEKGIRSIRSTEALWAGTMDLACITSVYQ